MNNFKYYINKAENAIMLGMQCSQSEIAGIIVNVKPDSDYKLSCMSMWPRFSWRELEDAVFPDFPKQKVKRARAILLDPNRDYHPDELFDEDGRLKSKELDYTHIITTKELFANIEELNEYIAELEKGSKYGVQIVQFPLCVNDVERWVECDE